MRRLVLVAILLAPALAFGKDQKDDEETDTTRLKLSLTLAQWEPRIYKARATTNQAVPAEPTLTLDGVGGDLGGGSLADTVGGASMGGMLLPTLTVKAFGGVHFDTGVELGLEAGARRLVARDGGATPSAFDFAGTRFAPGEPIDYKLEYASADLDFAFNVTFLEGWVRLELRAGFSYVYSRAQLTSPANGDRGDFSLGALIPAWGVGFAIRPVHMKIVAVEIYARARGGGWGTDSDTIVGLAQTEVGVTVTIYDMVAVTLGHRLESAQLDRDLSYGSPFTVTAPVTTTRSIRFAAEGAFLALAVGF